ncbi:MAG: RNA-binding S4 domain-containing protein [Oscillospiraceae bacterium]|nr:RNA-binding S4 domain-containing protein [Oscillospiraceae bacterium]
MEQTITIKTPFIRLDALLKFAGIAQTGGEAKIYILEGDVSYNGSPCTMRGKKCYPGDKVQIGDVSITIAGDVP